MNIKFTYRKGTILSDNEKDFLVQKSKSFGNVEIETYTRRFGAIDIVSFIETTVTFTALTNIQAFTKGFFGEDWFKNLGEKTRIELKKEIITAKAFIKTYYDYFIRNKTTIQEAFVISEQIGDITLYVVINHSQMTDTLLEKLPKALVDIYGKISLGYINVESKICQLFPEFEQNEWRYLLTPTYNGFGNFVDKYYDLNTNKIVQIDSKEEFISKFDLKEDDKYKLIISSLIER